MAQTGEDAVRPRRRNLGVREEAMDFEQVQSEQYEEIARILVPQIATLVQESGFIPPLEVLLTDANSHMVCCLQMNAAGAFRSLHDHERVLRAHFPVDVTVIDKNGKTWSTSLVANDLPSLLN
jgi:hypothetical protein